MLNDRAFNIVRLCLYIIFLKDCLFSLAFHDSLMAQIIEKTFSYTDIFFRNILTHIIYMYSAYFHCNKN